MIEPDDDVLLAAALLLAYDGGTHCQWAPACEEPVTCFVKLPDYIKLDGRSEVPACRKCGQHALSHANAKEVVSVVEDLDE